LSSEKHYIIIEEFTYVAEIFSHFDATVSANLSNLQKRLKKCEKGENKVRSLSQENKQLKF